MSRRSRSRSLLRAASMVAVVCAVGWAVGAAEAQALPVDFGARETPSPWSIGLVTSTIALTVGAVSAVLGIWVHRDNARPVVNAIAMTALVVSAVSVGITQGYMDARGGIRHQEDLDRMLGMVNEIALTSGDAALAEIVRSERDPDVEVPASTPEPDAEVPASPEPDVEAPATPEPDVEVPATPEPAAAPPSGP